MTTLESLRIAIAVAAAVYAGSAFTWRDVPLADGVNTVELRAGGKTGSCSWLCDPTSTGPAAGVEK